jgi:pimeloyl-ACP methyl ester carboxylesterase
MRIKKVLLNLLKIVVGLAVVGAGTYWFGPRPTPPVYPAVETTPAVSLAALEADLAARERAEPGIKPGCEATIVWVDSTKKEKTPYVFVYFHGFGASRQEGAPSHTQLATQFGANLLLARLDEHGVEEGQGNFAELTAESYVASAEYMLGVAKQLGDKVVLLGTSAGGAMSLFMASRHPDIAAVVAWSPCIRLYSGLSGVMAGPWGLNISRFVRGGTHHDWPYKKPVQAKYWTNHQRLEGLVQFALFLETAMVPETFAKIKCPVFVGYYYRDEENQDKLVSVAAMKTMITQLGTPPERRREMAFPNANDHVIGSEILSGDWQGVVRESEVFLKEMLK